MEDEFTIHFKRQQCNNAYNDISKNSKFDIWFETMHDSNIITKFIQV